MSIRGVGDAYAFQRLLWLLIGTVVVPTVLLSLYGAVAIRNQRAALLQEAREDLAGDLHALAGDLLAEVGRLDAAVRDRVESCAEPCAIEIDGVDGAWIWPAGEPLPPEVARTGLPSTLGAETVWVTPPDETAPLGAFVAGARGVAWRLDMEALQDTMTRSASARRPGGVFGLEHARPGPAMSLEETVARWQAPAHEVSLTLDRPLANWSLTGDFGEEDPIARALARTSWLSSLGLVALVGTVLAGTFVSLRSTLREIRLSRLQTDFVSNVGHELRTPMTSIRMFVETLQSGRIQDPEKIRECLDLLGQESDRLSRRIERVLSWARMEAGRRVYDVEDVPVAELVDEALMALRSHRLPDADLVDEEIRVEIPSDIPPLRVDRDAIVEALLNLVQNAVKYTDPPRRIVVAATRAPGRVGLSVQDNGPGIHRRDRRRIFEKFYQVDPLLTARGGSGLGLAIVRAVVQGHGGRVELDSQVGRGSRFTMWLPSA